MSPQLEEVESLLTAGHWADAIDAAVRALRANERRANWEALFLRPDPLPWRVLQGVTASPPKDAERLAAALDHLAAPELHRPLEPRPRLLLTGAIACARHAVTPGDASARREAVAALAGYFFSQDHAEAVFADVALTTGGAGKATDGWLLTQGAGDRGAVRLVCTWSKGGAARVLPDLIRFGFPDVDRDFLATVAAAGRFVASRGWHTRGTIRWRLGLEASESRRPLIGGSGWGAFAVGFRAAAQARRVSPRVAVSVAGSEAGALAPVSGLGDKFRSAASAEVKRVVFLSDEPLPSPVPTVSGSGKLLRIERAGNFQHVWRAVTAPDRFRNRVFGLVAVGLILMFIGSGGVIREVKTKRAEAEAARAEAEDARQRYREAIRREAVDHSLELVRQNRGREGDADRLFAVRFDAAARERLRVARDELEALPDGDAIDRRHIRFADAAVALADGNPGFALDRTAEWGEHAPPPEPPCAAIDFLAYRLRGEVLAAGGQHVDAVAALSRAVAIRPEELAANLSLGMCLLSADRPDDSERVLTHVEGLAAREPTLLLVASVAAGLRGDIERGRDGWTRASGTYGRATALVERVVGHDRIPELCRWRATVRVNLAVSLWYSGTLGKSEIVAVCHQALAACELAGEAGIPDFRVTAHELRCLLAFHAPIKVKGEVDRDRAEDRIGVLKSSLAGLDSSQRAFPDVSGLGHLALGLTYYDLQKFESAVSELTLAEQNLECTGTPLHRADALIFRGDALVKLDRLGEGVKSADTAARLLEGLLDKSTDPQHRAIVQGRLRTARKVIGSAVLLELIHRCRCFLRAFAANAFPR